MYKDVMDVKELSEYLGLGIAKVYQMIEKKEIPASRIGKQYRFLKDVINSWLRSNIILEDKEFLNLIRDVRKDFINAGYTQADIDKAVEKVRKKS